MRVTTTGQFLELLQRIKSQPALYIGGKSVSDLFMFLCGYQCAQQEFKISQTEHEFKLQNFQLWLQNKFRIMTSESWAKIILHHSLDEADAFDKFFVLFEDFLTDESI